MQVVAIDPWHTTLATMRVEVDCLEQIRNEKRGVPMEVAHIKRCVQGPKIALHEENSSNGAVATSNYAWPLDLGFTMAVLNP